MPPSGEHIGERFPVLPSTEGPVTFDWLFLDLNSYFASVEQQTRPELRGRPIAVVPVETDYTCAKLPSRQDSPEMTSGSEQSCRSPVRETSWRVRDFARGHPYRFGPRAEQRWRQARSATVRAGNAAPTAVRANGTCRTSRTSGSGSAR